MPPAVIDAMNDFRAALDRADREQSIRMAQAWLSATQGLDTEFDRLATEVANAASAGRLPSRWHLSRMQRYQSLMRQIAERILTYQRVAGAEVTEAQWVMALRGLSHSQQLIAMQLPSGLAGQFDRLPVAAVQNMVGIAGNGAPLGDLLRDSFADAAPDVAAPLIRGVALGWSPQRMARAMRDATNITLDRAMVIARSETNRVYREASRQQYIESGVVSGYIRVASKSARTCMACLLADGMFYPLDTPFEEHPNGRCTSVPQVKGAPRITYETGEQWFLRQDAATQREMMGPGRYEAWQQGRFDLGDLVTRRHNAQWGNSLQVTPLNALLAQSSNNQVIPLAPAPAPTPAPTPQVPSYAFPHDVSAQQRAVVDAHVMQQVRSYASANGLTEAEVLATVERVMQELLHDVPVSMRFKHHNFKALQRSERFMSQFETGSSGGSLNPIVRAMAEEKGLGYPQKSTPKKDRPIYGYFDTNEGDNAAYWYGGLQFVFKDEVKRRATFTMGDSLGIFQDDRAYGAPAYAPRIGAADTAIEAIMAYAGNGDKDDFLSQVALGYIEAQVHGTASLNDVQYVIDHNMELTSKERDWLQKRGIDVR